MNDFLSIGSLAPDFMLPDQTGTVHALQQYRGKWVLLYFYPADDTPGCTTEACSLRDNLPRFTSNTLVVLGVSADSVKSHAKFAAKYDLPFTLLSDDSTVMQQQYGVWRPKKLFGKEFLGTMRASYLIDPQGHIAKVYPKVKPETHAADVLADLASLQ